MPLNEVERVKFLSNVVCVIRADRVLTPRESVVLVQICGEIGGKKRTLTEALRALEGPSRVPELVGGFTVWVANCSAMLRVALADGDPSDRVILPIRQFAETMGLTEAQFELLRTEAGAKSGSRPPAAPCGVCGADIPSGARFCPACGSPANGEAEAPVTLVYEIPAQGFAIEFAESSAAAFPRVLELARAAPHYVTRSSGKKAWHLAGWPEDAMGLVASFANVVGVLRSRRCYHNGKEVQWDELFAFGPCARHREVSYRPALYCFGRDDGRINPWGCIQARLEWGPWAEWFSYGTFERAGLLGRITHWTFDKDRIRHDLMTNLHRFRSCPHLRLPLVEAVLSALPQSVEVIRDGPWKFSDGFEQKPGSIRVTEVSEEGDITITREYWADGVRPRSTTVLREILERAFQEVGIADPTPEHITS